MSYTVYGIRQRGVTEVRYVGHTSVNLEVRLKRHLGTAKSTHLPYAFHKWLITYEGQLEIFPIWEEETQKEARHAERAAIEQCVRLGQPILNQTYVPMGNRIGFDPPNNRFLKTFHHGEARRAVLRQTRATHAKQTRPAA